ncbi:hypothetical protein BV898_17404 [Hypsibius exemplaris]|uniref:Biogenesis of lysosome-related organelles complex 1 subunit 7 n=1 Tax=Hypsibius exemplaris TaxID=2072580 RepID=A0A9X6NI20_HYPEX|nr:hypothetical protein BV898_17404 [Hypsibius exemplaris]
MASKQQSTENGTASSLNKTGKVEESLPENLQDALVDAFRPIIHELDVVVEETRNSQQDVKRQIDLLSDEIYRVSTVCEVNPTLEMYAKKMATIKRRVTVMHNILQNVQERLKKLEQIGNARTGAPIPLAPPAPNSVSPTPVLAPAPPAPPAPLAPPAPSSVSPAPVLAPAPKD